jgi:ABC-type amino acid transport system permease subunit
MASLSFLSALLGFFIGEIALAITLFPDRIAGAAILAEGFLVAVRETLLLAELMLCFFLDATVELAFDVAVLIEDIVVLADDMVLARDEADLVVPTLDVP